QLARDADEEAVDSVLAFEIGGARENLLFVFQDGFDHFSDGGGGSVISRTGLEIFDDFGAAVAGALHEARDGGGVHQLGDGDAGNGGVARQRDHGVAVSAEDEGGDVLDADVKLLRDEGAEAGGVEHAGHADDAGVALLDRHGFEQVEAFALGYAFDDVDENDVGEFLGGDPVGGGGADVAGTYDGDFGAHEFLFRNLHLAISNWHLATNN